MKKLLAGGKFPEPTGTGLSRFLDWDDWWVLGMLADGRGGEHGQRLKRRDHYRTVYQTPEAPELEDLKSDC